MKKNHYFFSREKCFLKKIIKVSLIALDAASLRGVTQDLGKVQITAALARIMAVLRTLDKN